MVELWVENLKPGSILEGNAYDENENKVINKNEPITEESITSLKSNGVKKIHYIRILDSNKSKNNDNPIINQENFDKAVNLLSDIQTNMKKKQSMNLDGGLEKVIGNFVHDIERNYNEVFDLFPAASEDHYLHTHSINVSTMSILTAFSLSFDKTLIKNIGIAGFLFDIGKLLVPAEILKKPGKLTDNEWKVIKKHPIYTYNLLKRENIVAQEVLNGALLHHEWYAGGGYPLGVTQKKINPIAQVISIADVFDASTTDKPHKPRESYETVYSYILKLAGQKFNPVYARKFLYFISKRLNNVPVFQIGTYIILNTGEIGIVTGYNDDKYTLRPKLSLFANLKNLNAPLKFEVEINLQNEYERKIEQIITHEPTINKLNQIRQTVRKRT